MTSSKSALVFKHSSILQLEHLSDWTDERVQELGIF